MEALNTIFLLLFCLSFITFIVGMIKPSFLKLENRKRVSIFTIGALVIFFILFGITQTDEQKAKIAEDNKKAQETELAEQKKIRDKEAQDKAIAELAIKRKAEEEVKERVELELQSKSNLGMTPDQFIQELNSIIALNKFEMIDRIADPKIQKGDVYNAFNIEINPAIGMVGTVNKNGSLREVTFIFAGSDSKVDALEYMVISTMAAKVLSSQDKKASEKAFKLLEKAVQNNNKGSNEMIIDDVKYSVIVSKQLGLWFIASSVND